MLFMLWSDLISQIYIKSITLELLMHNSKILHTIYTLNRYSFKGRYCNYLIIQQKD